MHEPIMFSGTALFAVMFIVGTVLGLSAGCTQKEKKGKGFSKRRIINQKIPVNEDLLTVDEKQHSNKDFIPEK